MPTVELPPATPLTCQVTAVFVVFSTEAVNALLAPVASVALLGLTLTLMFATVTVADADRVGSATETAVTVTVAGVGMVAGAVYRPVLEIVPTVVLPPMMLLTCQVTPVFEPALATFAWKAWVPPPASTIALPGVTVTATGGEIVTPAKPVAVGSCTDTASTDTFEGDGTFAGGVYRPALETVPTVLLPPGMPLTCQVTV